MDESSTDLLPMSAIPGPKRMSIIRGIWEQVKFDHDPVRYMYDLRAKYGDLTRFQNRLGTMLLAIGPEYNRPLHQETDLFHSRPFVLPGGKGTSQHRLRQSIFSLNEAEHKRMRHQLLPVFQRSMMDLHQHPIRRHIETALADWQPGQVRNLHRDMHLLVWSVVRDLLYGLDSGTASEALHEGMEHWMFQTFSPWVRAFPFNIPFTPYNRMIQDANRLERKFLDLMRKRRAQGCNGNDALSALLRFRTADGKEVPVEQLVGHALILFLVAYETTGNTLTWTLFLLSQFPQTQQDVLDELASLGPNAGYDQLEQLPLLNRVLKESMRLLPAVPYSRRLASRDGGFGRYEIKKKTRVIFSHYMTHHLPEVYQNPERFDPARWETIKPSPAEYMPFGAGPRTCLGSQLAQCVIKLAIAKILPQWKLDVVPHTVLDRLMGISLGPRNGIPVILSKQDRDLHKSPITGNIRDMVEIDHPEPAKRVRVAA
ncbi:MAG: cytochrome P450 [Gemmataceae bacterium]